MRTRYGTQGQLTALGASLLLVATSAAAQPSRPPPPPAASQAAPAAPTTQPQQTTATFADWTLRCTRISPTAQSCEIAQGVSSQERTIAQLAIGRVAKGQPLHLTILVPPSVSFAAAPALTVHDGDPALLTMTWRRCLPGGCVADGAVADDLLHRLRGMTEPARVVFADAGGRVVALPVSPQGLPQALDALAKEDGG